MLNTQTTPTTRNPNTTAVKVIYTVLCKEPNVYQEFSDFDTAHTFANQLAQDFPTAHIEKAKVTLFFDDWDNGGQA
ncbi:DUF3110 domain-containing protein [Moraxella bovis]|uniref:DUF3110 domain-containing protein n=1 Tax=Moraxella bovis TaxID=476 RepID=UPI002227BE2A|nr:DUF3110 domain-containing protein [Moraxella bovis]UYZ70014.1 DUF3110 domain-containing protein [Moraxella bovis]UYZ74072.1 DUF3110 domain-containing protein [Moraxella bovis]UZA13305.1 DUF3110 domain-containing protein [Moraxella bovis]UZA43956.1 DUF3110 domain-containing protein [Moraxella bovis]